MTAVAAVLLDVEGTTTALSFVHDVLFPYARRHLEEFVRLRAKEAQVAEILNEVRRDLGSSTADDASVVAKLSEWMAEDRKVTPLKQLQGLIWEDGYRQDRFRGHVYPDASEAIRRWHGLGIRLYVFSSGSVQAQELLFEHSDQGRLTQYLHGHFDTKIGSKRDPESYRRIASTVELAPSRMLFLSDITEELDAASEAGMQVYQLVRGDDVQSRHPQARDFTEIPVGSHETVGEASKHD